MLQRLFNSKKLGLHIDSPTNIQASPQRADWAKISVSLFVACIIVIVSFTEIFRLPELLTYDKFVYFSYEKAQKNHVLLLEVEQQDLTQQPDLLTNIINDLLTKNPKHILLMNPLEKFNGKQIQSWLKSERVDYVPTVFRTSLDGGAADFKYNSSKALQSTPPLGFALPADSNLGITRTAPLSLSLSNGQKVESFQSVLTEISSQTTASIYINFNQGAAPIPRYQGQKLLDVGIIEELVKDKTVLVIPAPNDFMPGLVTPKNNYAEPLLPYYTQAMMLNSLLNESEISMLKTWQTSIICFVIFIAFLFSFQWLNM